MSMAETNPSVYRHSLAIFQSKPAENNILDETSAAGAADALREVEVAAADPDASNLDSAKLHQMDIDELREVAKVLDVPDRGAITDQDELVAAIARCL